MARRKDHTREELKEMSVVSARKIIAAQGLSNLNMRRIAGDIGYTVGTLYNVFEDMDDLMMHINAATLDSLYAALEKDVPQNDKNATRALKRIAKTYIRFAEENFNLWNVLTNYEQMTEEDRPDWYMEKTARLFRMVEQYLTPLCKSSAKAERSAKILWASVHGICVLGLNGRLDIAGAAPVQSLTDTLIENYMKGLK
ncbi:MAG: TetR/AcrR family transcriptional regulator [Alphaproteobacteria bacterium]|nr:MAG: TetR/AcrR family transcriptional regulator [Alphaproteobacteria bacterium]